MSLLEAEQCDCRTPCCWILSVQQQNHSTSVMSLKECASEYEYSSDAKCEMIPVATVSVEAYYDVV